MEELEELLRHVVLLGVDTVNHPPESNTWEPWRTDVRAKRCTPTYAITRCNASFLAPAMALVS
jgi:hypothetical protein